MSMDYDKKKTGSIILDTTHFDLIVVLAVVQFAKRNPIRYFFSSRSITPILPDPLQKGKQNDAPYQP